jgi:Domain of unknown function (DUF222)/HNH endonuclease
MTATANPRTAREPTDYERHCERCERLEAQMTELWAYMNVGTHRFLRLVAEYDRDKGCERHGLVHTAQWLNWQCGIGTLAAREKVRVARALGGLPAIDAAFAKGEVSYSKVRAMTRVATPANEAALLNIARCGTASHVEKLVRKYRWTQRRDAAKLAKEQHLGRQAFFFYDDNDAFVLHARLPPEVGAIMRKALEVAGDILREATRADVSAETSPRVSAETGSGGVAGVWTEAELEPSAAAKRADALRLMAETFLNCRSEEVEATSSADRYQVVMHIDQAVLTDEIAACADEPHRSELDAGPALALDTVRRLGCDCTLVGIVEGNDGEPLNIGRKTRAIPESIRRALRSRDGGCRFPGCDRTRFTDGHHVKHWADGGETKLANLVTLCGFHHMLVHEGGYGVTAIDDGAFVFTRPDGRRIAGCGARPPIAARASLSVGGTSCDGHASANGAGESFRGNFSGSAAEDELDPFEQSLPSYVRSLNPSLRIDSRTGRCQWLGETMDYSLAVEGLQSLDGGWRPIRSDSEPR